jgi:hypothetical protein
MGGNLLESGGKDVGGFAGIPDCREAFPNRDALPVAIGFGLLPVGTRDLANCLIHDHDSWPQEKACISTKREKPEYFSLPSNHYIPRRSGLYSLLEPERVLDRRAMVMAP